ncbi:MAG: J domain-containing protein [Frankia sp.]
MTAAGGGEVDQKSLYDVLGLPPTASDDEVRAAYRASMRRVHPDVGGSEPAFSLVRAAYRVLGDPERRHRYDLQLASALDERQRPPGADPQQRPASAGSAPGGSAPGSRPGSGSRFDGQPPGLDARTRRNYFVAMGVCVTLFVLAALVVRLFSVPAALAMMAVAAVIPPFAAIAANRAPRPDRPRPDPPRPDPPERRPPD